MRNFVIKYAFSGVIKSGIVSRHGLKFRINFAEVAVNQAAFKSEPRTITGKKKMTAFELLNIEWRSHAPVSGLLPTRGDKRKIHICSLIKNIGPSATCPRASENIHPIRRNEISQRVCDICSDKNDEKGGEKAQRSCECRCANDEKESCTSNL